MSYKLDVPTAPVIVAGLALVFFALLIVKIFRHKQVDSTAKA